MDNTQASGGLGAFDCLGWDTGKTGLTNASRGNEEVHVEAFSSRGHAVPSNGPMCNRILARAWQLHGEEDPDNAEASSPDPGRCNPCDAIQVRRPSRSPAGNETCCAVLCCSPLTALSTFPREHIFGLPELSVPLSSISIKPHALCGECDTVSNPREHL